LTQTTIALILRAVKYGETSLVVTAFTEKFGLQSYMVKGVRTSSAKGPGKAALFQPGALLDMEVYRRDNQALQFIKTFRWHYLYRQVHSSVIKNAVVLFMVELLLKCLKHPEENSDLFSFCEDCLVQLDQCEAAVSANLPLFFALHLAVLLGFRLSDDYTAENHILDLQDGGFSSQPPPHNNYLAEPHSHTTAELLKVRQPAELSQFVLNQHSRRHLLDAYLLFYKFHIPDFGELRSVEVMRTVLG
jgi:DNA repair protein RecO (recombination protein O)